MIKINPEPCALCGGTDLNQFGPYCKNESCVAYRWQAFDVYKWNDRQRRIVAELRKAFEAGVLNSTVFKLGDGELLPSELLTRLFDDYLAERKA